MKIYKYVSYQKMLRKYQSFEYTKGVIKQYYDKNYIKHLNSKELKH